MEITQIKTNSLFPTPKKTVVYHNNSLYVIENLVNLNIHLFISFNDTKLRWMQEFSNLEKKGEKIISTYLRVEAKKVSHLKFKNWVIT